MSTVTPMTSAYCVSTCLQISAFSPQNTFGGTV